jgi:hypothetical protein
MARIIYPTTVPAGGIEVKGLREIERERQEQRTAEPTPENPEPDE